MKLLRLHCDQCVPVADARVGFSRSQYITQEGEGEVHVTVSIQSLLNLIMEHVSGNFSVSLTPGGTAQGMHMNVSMKVTVGSHAGT